METDSTPIVGALSTKKAAEYIGVSDSFLRKTRMKKSEIKGPTYKKFGSKVLYRICDLEDYLDRLPSNPSGAS